MRRTEILDWLREERPGELCRLWKTANRVRRENVGSGVHLRGLIEFSNRCRRSCSYCGIRSPNRKIARYRMCADEIQDCAGAAVRRGFGTVVLQSGEDPELSAEWMADLILGIKAETKLSVTLSLGERTKEELALWRRAGADRYLLRFETSNPRLYKRFHPSLPGRDSDRLALLAVLRTLGYETGSGILVGLPGQTHADLARDIDLFGRLDLDMIGLGPYIPHPDTPLGKSWKECCAPPDRQVPNTEEMTYKVLALARLICPRANIPVTTAVATLNRSAGFELGLSRGANVIMPNVTPMTYRRMYAIYPGKACAFENHDSAGEKLRYRIQNEGRFVGRGRGDSPNYAHRTRSKAVREAVL
jgi:biotin synthase